MKILLHHVNFSLQSRWKSALLGLAIFPLTPLFGAICLGWAILGTLRQQYQAVVSRPLNRGFMLLSVLLILSASFAYNKTEAFVGLFNFIPYFIAFASLSVLIQTVAQLRQLSWMLVITSVPVIVVGLGQLLLGWATPPQGWIGFLGWEIAPGGEPPGRMSSIFMYANSLAGYLIVVFILELGLWVEYWRLAIGDWRLVRQPCRRREVARRVSLRANFGVSQPRGLRSRSVCLAHTRRAIGDWRLAIRDWENFSVPNPQSLVPFLFLTLAILLNLVALILTNSRSAWAIAMFACLAYALYQGWRILVTAVTGVVASVLLAAFAPTPVALLFRQFIPRFFWARLNDQLYPDRPVALLRKTQWQFAVSMAQERPWTGWGLRNFTVLYEAKMQIWLGHPHSLFLMLFAETGVPATLVFCGLFCWIFVGGVRLLKNSKFAEDKNKTILFSYLVVLIGWVFFNTVDVSLFDFRLNVISWLLFSALAGVIYRYNRQYVGH